MTDIFTEVYTGYCTCDYCAYCKEHCPIFYNSKYCIHLQLNHHMREAYRPFFHITSFKSMKLNLVNTDRSKILSLRGKLTRGYYSVYRYVFIPELHDCNIVIKDFWQKSIAKLINETIVTFLRLYWASPLTWSYADP